MTKKAEKEYFDKIGQDGLDYTLGKPFFDRMDTGILLSNLASVFTMISNRYHGDTLDIIDIGCGSGWTSYYLAKAGHNVIGVDISKTAIEAAKNQFKGLDNLSYKVADYEYLDGKHKYDAAIFIDSLHHCDDEYKTLQSVYKILKDGAICIICEPGKNHHKALDAIEATKKYGVNENDVIPTAIVKKAHKIGFKSMFIYSHPSLIHRAIYKTTNKNTWKGKISSIPILKTLVIWYCSSIKKRSEGLIVLQK